MARSADPGLAKRRRSQILAAALSCFRRRGFHQSTMQEICAEAALSPGAVYRYFPSKTEIIAAIAEEERLEDGGVLAAATGDDLIDRLCVFARHFVEMAVKNGDAPLVADVMSEALRNRAFAARLTRASARMEQRLVAAIEAGQKSGVFSKALDPPRAARIILGALDGLCLRGSIHRQESAGVAADVRIALESLLRPQSATNAPRETAEIGA